jgi:hypothetical protein
MHTWNFFFLVEARKNQHPIKLHMCIQKYHIILFLEYDIFGFVLSAN